MGDGEALKGGLNRGLEEKEAVGVDAEAACASVWGAVLRWNRVRLVASFRLAK